MAKIYIGIDNGLDGAIVVNYGGELVVKEVMPTLALGKGRKVDILQVGYIIGNERKDGLTVLIERPAGSQNVNAAKSMADSFARIETLLILEGIRYIDITAKQWQKTYWTTPRMASGQKFNTKAAALIAANKLWPSENWLKSDRCRVAHDGIVDSALIAEYGRRLDL